MVVRKQRVSKTRIRINFAQAAGYLTWKPPIGGTDVRPISWVHNPRSPYWQDVPCEREPTHFNVHLWLACYAYEQTFRSRDHFNYKADARRRLRFEAIKKIGVDLSVMEAVAKIYEATQDAENLTYIEIGPNRKDTIIVPDLMLVSVSRYLSARKQRMVRRIDFYKLMQEVRHGNEEG